MSKENDENEYLMSSLYMALVLNKMNSDALVDTIRDVADVKMEVSDFPSMVKAVNNYTEQVIETLSKKYGAVFIKHKVLDKVEALIDSCIEKDESKKD